MENKPLMKCGHVANATMDNGKPFCVICDCFDVSDKKINLEGREAKCTYCGKTAVSRDTLPFFEYKPESEHDAYYCGCYGWN